MANIKSAKKAIRQTKTRTARNKALKESMRKEIKAVRTYIEEKKSKEANEAFVIATKKITRQELWASRGSITL